MNPDEQDRNPFRRRTSASSRTGRYLSGRPNFSQQQTPDFFSQAMAQNTPAPTQKNRVNKKPIFITLGILGIIAFIVLTVTVIIPMIGDIIASTDKNHSITELQAVAKEYYKDVINMELIIEASVKDNTVLKIPEDLNTRQSIEEKGIKNRADVSKRIEEFLEKLDKFGGVMAYDRSNNEINLDSTIEEAKTKLSKHKEVYDDINTVYSAVANVYISNGEESKIEKLRNCYEDDDLNKVADLLRDSYSTIKTKDGTEIGNVNEKLKKDETLANVLRKIGEKASEDNNKTPLTNLLSQIINARTEKAKHE